MKELKQVREILIEMLEDLDERLLTITNEGTQYVTKSVEYQAFEAENDEAVDLSGGAVREEMEQIKQTLLRIDEGTYGICLSCGQAIKTAQIKENILSSRCVHCTK